MPTLQVLKREPEPYADMIADTGKNIADNIIKRQAMELTKNELAIKSKMAKTEEEKLFFDQLKTFQAEADKFGTGVRDGSIPKVLIPQRIKQLSLLAGGKKELMSTMAELGKMYRENLDALGPQEGEANEAQFRGAQVKNQEASAIEAAAKAKFFSGDFPGGPGDTSGQGGQSFDQQGIPQESRVNAVNGQSPKWTATEMTAAGPKYVNQGAQNEAKYQETATGEQAKMDVKNKPTRELINTYLSDLDKAFEETGGSKDTVVDAFISGQTKSIEAMFKKGSILPSVRQREGAIGMAVGSTLNGGRPTEKDQQLGESVTPKFIYPKATNAALARSLDNIFNSSISNTPTENVVGKVWPFDIPMSAQAKVATQRAQDIIKTNKAFAEHLKTKGATPEEIEQGLEMLNQQRGW